MPVSPINLPTHQRAPRKLLITVAEWTDGSTQKREVLGRRTEDSSIAYTADIETTTDILGINYTDVNRLNLSRISIRISFLAALNLPQN